MAAWEGQVIFALGKWGLDRWWAKIGSTGAKTPKRPRFVYHGGCVGKETAGVLAG